ncbi:MAG: hypothetical protein LKH78_04155 [Weizmannia coagulans]|jgi:hypothetical protein|uniref:hypothetical protein n=1 Tax=Heyndrickxia TaxID=2837504 RepID=UPI000416741C|nr:MULTISPECIES: hypothetical protein [Heyndrickxia]NWN94674.1 hypothetical protein [Bacillus sp. (in: firmicutes)]APB38094.1 hypothetical protein BIZ35_15900 [Heyndrickxia coagulans]KGT37503.1 hypothetical protein P421_14975 [Heyndrickxia coagulans P38]KYC66328.1 hypothetical protein B4100_1054 [Heyndrickxia coagulans]KYC86063.1 hypothetical protein B4096_1039 [Heyndrickxia coagulans]
MDRYSCLAYLLFQTDDNTVKEAAIRLVQGSLTLEEAKSDSTLKPYLEACEKRLNIQPPDAEQVYAFMENYIYAV